MKKILVIRNDKIGDFMLAWPAFAMLKQAVPDAEITALVPPYTEVLAQLCPSIDKVIVDCGQDADKSSKKALVREIKSHRFDASICFFSNTYNALLVWKAGIEFRLAPATKLCQFLYNHRVVQRRSRSIKPEFQYNLDLASAFLTRWCIYANLPKTPYLLFTSEELAEQKNKLAAELAIKPTKPWIFVHAGTGGSANNISLEQYRDLVSGICDERSVEVILTAGPGEQDKAIQLKALLLDRNISSVVYDKNDGLADFTRSIACADIFTAGSTGPLHIAGAIDVPTIGFFPAKRSATSLRWQPINSEGRHIAFSPPIDTEKTIAEDMSRIHITEILPDVKDFLRRMLLEQKL